MTRKEFKEEKNGKKPWKEMRLERRQAKRILGTQQNNERF
jgi:hypothetical protein